MFHAIKERVAVALKNKMAHFLPLANLPSIEKRPVRLRDDQRLETRLSF
jgi:hypothetical protein